MKVFNQISLIIAMFLGLICVVRHELEWATVFLVWAVLNKLFANDFGG